MCDPEGTVHYDSIGVIQGMRNLPATFTPGKKLGPGLDETLENLQRICDEQELATPDHRTQGNRGHRLESDSPGCRRKPGTSPV